MNAQQRYNTQSVSVVVPVNGNRCFSHSRFSALFCVPITACIRQRFIAQRDITNDWNQPALDRGYPGSAPFARLHGPQSLKRGAQTHIGLDAIYLFSYLAN
ncbi:MAG: hypothetical protein HY057_10810 [Rhodospirillales bacterium]|nr:hypothetical protein [Rhodospirillales bacterium]